MSASPTSRSPDLARLVEEGYDLSLLGGLMLVRRLPYVGPFRQVREGVLVVPLNLRGDVTTAPRTHLVSWIGKTPHTAEGEKFSAVVWKSGGMHTSALVETTHTFCVRPPGREFHDYHELVTTYATLLGTHAERLSPGVMARFGGADATGEPRAVSPVGPQPWTGSRRRSAGDGAPRYADTASSRAGIDGLNARLSETVGIIGLGGTGSHVLDFVVKTAARAIHLFDADTFEQHNAFRSPGAASLADVSAGRKKVDHFARVYSAMRTGIVPHAVRIDERNAHLLDGLGFCFVCIDDAPAKAPILDRLSSASIPWIDVGMGLAATPDGIVGALRTTSGTPTSFDEARRRIPTGPAVRDDYALNVQTGDLNALNAALAVVEWKRMRGFYASDRTALSSVLIVGDGLCSTETLP